VILNPLVLAQTLWPTAPFAARLIGDGGGVVSTRPKVAVTVRGWVMLTVHVPVPLHPSPLQPVKPDPAAGVAVRVTLEPEVMLALQVVPQVMAAGLEVTAPVPAPLFATVSAKFCSENVAVTLLVASIGTAHVPVPVQAPLQPMKVEPVAGVALRVTVVVAA